MLQQIGIYLLKVISISGLLFLYYHIALRNKRFHYYNRFYLLFSVAISITLPLLKLEWFTFFSNSDQTIQLYGIMYGGGENEMIAYTDAGINWQHMAVYILTAISIIMVAVFCLRIARIQFLKKKYPVQQFAEFDFINTDIASAPFSFLKDIFWRNDIDLDEETGKQILQHEITHIRQKHSWDKLFMQLIMCFYWMNPFFHLLKRELYLIHEFIADEEAVKHADADAFAKMLLTAQFGKFNFLPAQSIFYSSIKRRLIMLTTSKKPQFSYVRRLMILPLIATLVCLFAFTIKKENAPSAKPPITTVKPFVLVVDAGHGGKDLGAAGNGLYEKDVALLIVKKIKDLSSQYGVNVILTRENDVFMSPQERSNFANDQNADAFISVHINSAATDIAAGSGFEVMLSPNTEKFASENQLLGSAVLQNISKNFTAAATLQESKSGIWILKNSNIPATLIECGYITDANDARNLKDDSKIELMAKNILEGVAAYANNMVSASTLYQLKNEPAKDTAPTSITIRQVKDTSTPARIIIKEDKQSFTIEDKQPLIIVDGKPASATVIKEIDPITIESVTVLKDSAARTIYGPKADNGVVLIVLKPGKTETAPVYVLNDVIISAAEFKGIKPESIESVNVLKDKTATDKYGAGGKNGVIEIRSKEGVTVTKIPDDVLYTIDGKIVSKEDYKKLDTKKIESVNVLKSKTATDKYGDKGKNGVIEIKLKQTAPTE